MFQDSLKEACTQAGKVIKDYTEKKEGIKRKKKWDGSIVTEGDIKSEEAILNILNRDFPTHGILSEEKGKSGNQNSEYLWIIDPIDGSTNFSKKNPLCCVSIGLERQGEIILGGIYCPFVDEYFFAEKGEGAYMNDTPIKVSAQEEVEGAVFAISLKKKDHKKPTLPQNIYSMLVENGIYDRRIGASALDLCWVACGRYDGMLVADKVSAWDIAAGMLIVKEAGGIVSTLTGNFASHYEKSIIACNEHLHHHVMKLSPY